MGTFFQWLDEQREAEGPAGEVSRWWAGEAAVRPRTSTPSGIQKHLDRQLREGSLAHLEQDAKGRMREQFADAVRAYHDRDKPEAAKLDEDGTIRAFMAETREALRMLRVRTDQIAAKLGLDTPYGERAEPVSTGEITITASPGGVGLPTPGGTFQTAYGPVNAAGEPLELGGLNPGHVEALRVRARLGDEAARELLAQHGFGVGEAPAGQALDAPDPAAEGLEPHPAYNGDPPGAGEALGTAWAELAPDEWDLLWRVADHVSAAQPALPPADYWE